MIAPRRSNLVRAAGLALAILGSPALAAAPAAAAGTCSGYTIYFVDDLFSYEPDYVDYVSQPGSPLTVVGTVNKFCWLFADLDAASPMTEYTMHLGGAYSNGTSVEDLGNYWRYTTAYWGGSLAIYSGSPPNAPPPAAMPANPPNASVPSSFTDGWPLLSGPLDSFQFFDGSGTQTATVRISVYVSKYDNTVLTEFETRCAFNDGYGLCRVQGAPPLRWIGLRLGTAGDLPSGYSARASGSYGALNSYSPGPPQVSVSPSCVAAGHHISQNGTGFFGNSSVELHFIRPDGTEYAPPHPTEPVDFCGNFYHSYSGVPEQFGAYQFYAIGQQTGAQSANFPYKLLFPGGPPAPTALEVANTGTGTSLRLSWNPSPSPHLSFYRVYRWTQGRGAEVVGWPTGTQFEDVGPLTRDQTYYYFVSATDCGGVESPGSGAVAGVPGYFPVLLVHGICSDAGVWNSFAEYLFSEGFQTRTLTLDPPNGNISSLSQQIHNRLEEIVVELGAPTVNLVAHSMGGLVARYYVRNRKRESRIGTLVTLGTPHHGSDLASSAYEHPTIARHLGSSGEAAACLVLGPALEDMQTGSESTNVLNYDVPNSDQNPNGHDEFRGDSWVSHAAERSYDPDLVTWTIAGTKPFRPSTRRLFKAVWAMEPTLEDNHPTAPNDGLVGTVSAMLHARPDRFRTDGELGLLPMAHFDSPFFYQTSRALTNAPELFPIVAELLRNGDFPAFVAQPASDSRVALRTSTPNDTVVSIVLAENGSLAAGQATDRGFALSGAAACQISMSADAALLSLRTPGGTWLSAADTTANPWLHYDEDSESGLAIFLLDVPADGTWLVRVDGAASPHAQTFAVTAEAVTTRRLVLDPLAQERLSAGNSHVTMRVEDAGVTVVGTSWDLLITRPDASTTTAAAFDDGAHADGAAGDGIFGADIPVNGSVGSYRVDVTGMVLADSATYVRAGSVALRHLTDLAVDGEVSVAPSNFSAGDSVEVSATIQNVGEYDASDVQVEFWDGTTRFHVESITLGAGGSTTIAARWHVAAPDTHVLLVVVNPFEAIGEANFGNNTTTRTVVIEQPVTDAQPQGAPALRFAVGPFLPNPARGDVELRFYTASSAPARLSIYDVQGRRRKQWYWANLSAGPHALRWNGVGDDGQAVHAGVMFVRLVMNGRTAVEKLVLTR